MKSERVLQSRASVPYAIITAFELLALAGFILYWISLPDWRSDFYLTGLLTVILALPLANSNLRWAMLPLMKRPRFEPAPPELRVAVVTAFVPGVESIRMLSTTVRAMVSLDYPHDTWVLDEGDDPAVKALCKKYGALHFSRKHIARYQRPAGAFAARTKHGNYNAWLDHVGFQDYDVISAFDSDHIPNQNFLNEVLGYFADGQIGYVQAAQVYYNQESSFIAAGAAEETYEFYSISQMANFGLQYPTIIGCHNTHRVSALKEIGGFAAHDADDLLITVHYRSRGWRGVYVPKILARGIVPVDWSGYLIQQRRWARSVLDIKFRRQRLPKSASISTRLISVLHGFNYLQPVTIGLLTTAFIVCSLWSGHLLTPLSEPSLMSIAPLGISLGVCELFRRRFYLDPANEGGFHWRSRLLRIAKWPWMALALIDALSGREFRYTITRKDASESRPFMLWSMHGPILLLILTTWFLSTLLGRIEDSILHVAAGVVSLALAGLIATDYRSYPPPFNRRLAEQQLRTSSKECVPTI